MRRLLGLLLAMTLLAAPVSAQPVESWATVDSSCRGRTRWAIPPPQPDQRFLFPEPARGARDQTLRLMVRPSYWGQQARLRFTNALGTKPLVLDGVHRGLQLGGAALVPGTNQPVRFGGQGGVTIPPGEMSGRTRWRCPSCRKARAGCCRAASSRSASMWRARAGR